MILRGPLFAGALAVSIGTAAPALAHQLNVFASTDCKIVLVEATFSSGRTPVMGEVRVLDGANTLMMTGPLEEDGTLRFPLADVDASTGILIEVSTPNHEDYWILTPEDIARKCQS